MRNAPGHEWLQAYGYEIVRYTCKYLGDAYAAFFDPDRPDHGRPQYKARHYTQPAFTIPSHVRIEDGSLYIPKMGWTRLGPVHRYADGQPLTVRIKQESEGRQPKWHACIVFEVPVDHPDVCRPAEAGAVGDGPQRGTGHGQHRSRTRDLRRRLRLADLAEAARRAGAWRWS